MDIWEKGWLFFFINNRVSGCLKHWLAVWEGAGGRDDKPLAAINEQPFINTFCLLYH